ncbi:MAG: carboxypeptidase-like regulatory domain-containing protein [Cyclobacteriaceae bacterium]
MKFKTVLILTWLLSVAGAWAQEKKVITGKVTDKISGEALPSVNVFLANTTMGTSSGADGSFILQNIPNGKYDLIASSVGYKPYFLSVDLSGSENGYTKEVKVNIVLEPEVKELSEITVRADSTNWARHFSDFKRHFIGRTKLSKKCKILNPKVLHFYLDPRDGVLVAHAKKPLEILNEDLGYKINYYLYQFEYEMRTGKLMVFGVPLFEELPAASEKVKLNRERERKKAYNGSIIHFMRSLARNQLKDAGFRMTKIYTIPNRNRLPDDVIEKKIKQLNPNGGPVMISFYDSPKDSLSYYYRMRSEPKEKDSISATSLTGQEFWNEKTEQFESINGRYKVTFNEPEEKEYLAITGKKRTKNQESYFIFSLPNLKIYPNGYYEDVQTLIVTGYLSWHEKMATLLPGEYEPAPEGEKSADKQ